MRRMGTYSTIYWLAKHQALGEVQALAIADAELGKGVGWLKGRFTTSSEPEMVLAVIEIAVRREGELLLALSNGSLLDPAQICAQDLAGIIPAIPQADLKKKLTEIQAKAFDKALLSSKRRIAIDFGAA